MVKNAKREGREIALQALYAWQLTGGDPVEQARVIGAERGAKSAFAEKLAAGVRDDAEALKGRIAPHLDRDFARLSPVERCILYIGAFELGKSYGGTEGHRFVNGVLEKVAVALRPEEVARNRNTA